MIKNKILLTACFALVAFVAKGQNVEGVSPVDGAALSSGTSSSAGSDIVNVDLYTGIGTATIPIYNYTLGDLDLGIALSYNMKGIEVGQTASSVGLGWKLNAGGEITRTINQFEDEVLLYHISDTSSDGSPTQFYAGIYGVTVWSFMNTHEQDKAYDEYHINMAGRNVDMIWTGKWWNETYFYPKSELSVRFIRVRDDDSNYFDDYTMFSFPQALTSAHNSTTPFRLGIYVIDEKGNQFLYIPGDQEYKYYDFPNAEPSFRWVVNKWVLSKIRSANGNEVKFNYTRNYVAYRTAETQKITEYFKTSVDGAAPPALDATPYSYSWEGYVSQLSSIEYPNGVKAIVHSSKTADKRCDIPNHFIVDSITIESEYGQEVKNAITYKFNYSSFHTPTNNPNTEVVYGTPCNDIEPLAYDMAHSRNLRLKLKSIDRVGNHTISENFYSFDYHSTPLPSRFSFQRDFYDYYNNGYSTSIAGVPLHLYDNNNGTTILVGTDRRPDTTSSLTYIQAGLLKKITNGLGGTIEMQYAKPEMINPLCQNGKNPVFYNGCTPIDTFKLDGQDATDGLVVQSILLTDGVSEDHDEIIEYEYSGGQRFYRGGYFWIPTEIDMVFGVRKIRAREYNSNMYSPRDYFHGSNHGFSEVVVTRKQNQSGEQLAKTKYMFSNLMLSDSLTDIYTKAYKDSLLYGHDKFYHDAGRSGSNIAVQQDMYTHTAPVSRFDKFNMGLLLNKKEYNFNDEVTIEEDLRYDVNFLENLKDSTQRRLYKYSMPFYFKENGGPILKTSNIYCNTQITGGVARLKEKTVKTYNDTRIHIVKYNYEYDNFDNITSVTWKDSKGDIIQNDRIYFYDKYTTGMTLYRGMQHLLIDRTTTANPSAPTTKYLFSSSIVAPTISSQECVFPSDLSYINGYNSTWFLSRLGFEVGDTLYVAGIDEARQLQKLRFSSVYKSTQVKPINMNTAKHDENNAILGQTGLPTLEKVKEYTKYDCRENILEMRVGELNRFNSFIWDSRYGHKIAEVNNARFDEVAYTGFEGLNEDTGCTTDYGNWNFSPSAVIYPPAVGGTTPQALTGKYIYNLNLANITTQLKPNTDYELTFWADIDPKVSINSSQQSLTLKRQGAWSLYSLKFTSGSSDVLTIEDNSSMTIVGFIDELRLYPAKATMTTYTYEPLFGISSVCDSRNNILYTEYDAQGRPTIVRDINHAIISKTDTRNQTNNN